MGPEESVRSKLSFDSEQNGVILASSSARLHVEAGPGSGKTAVACARVSNLIQDGIDPANILLISFTRTAVQEMRDRIGTFLADPRDAAAVRIATVDSFSWRFWTGVLKDEIENAFLGYEATIAGALSLLKARPPELLDYLSQVAHVLIDEAQDVQARYKNKDFTIVGISMDIPYENLKDATEAWGKVKPFIAKSKINYPILMGSESLFKEFGLTQLPDTLLIDKTGRIAAVYVGLISKDNVETNIGKLLSE